LNERFIARQPILDTRLQLHGYELLFRGSGAKDAFMAPSATSQVIADSTMVFDWADLVGEVPAFVNFSVAELTKGIALLLSRQHAVIEIPPETELSNELVSACRSLHKAGYRLALDGFADLPAQRPLVEFSDYLKVDFHDTSRESQADMGARYATGKSRLVAKKIENWAEYDRARKLGFSFLQGFFFLEPQILHKRDVPNSRLNALSLLNAVHKSPLDIPEVEAVLKRDPGLTYKLLRYLNSPIMERRAEIHSVSNAVQLLGESTFRRWATLAAIVTPASDKPSELVHMALTRALLCEKIAERLDREDAYEFFLVGLLSLTPAILDQSLSHIVAGLPLSSRVSEALLGQPNPLRYALDAVLAYEQAEWEQFVTFMERVAVPENAVPECFVSASRAARNLVSPL
jgi:c-di-GMP-related signal transduction protein